MQKRSAQRMEKFLWLLKCVKSGLYGGGIGMGNTCKPMAVSFQCMTKSTTKKKKKKVGCEVLCWRFLAGWCSWFGRPVEADNDQTETLIKNNHHYALKEIANILKISKSSLENHLHQLGFINHFDVWVPHMLRKKENPSWPYFHMWFST